MTRKAPSVAGRRGSGEPPRDLRARRRRKAAAGALAQVRADLERSGRCRTCVLAAGLVRMIMVA
ncbi:hypothetical protein GCM10020220_113100 [Nonomuraea rubra]